MMLQHWVRRRAQERPEATALVSGNEVWSYGDLETASNQVARALLAAGCRRGDRVCLFLPKNSQTIAALLGVLKADCVYVPVDTASPAARVAKILESCAPRVALAQSAAGSLLAASLRDRPVVPAVGWLDISPAPLDVAFDLEDVRRQPPTAPDSHDDPAAPAHILFTSGSTGVPKGVVITHANVVAFVEWAVSYFGLGPSDRNSSHTPLHFDLSTFDMFGSFGAGAQLHLVPSELGLLPGRLAEFIRTSELTLWFSVPSVLNYLAKHDAVREGDFPTLKRLMWCGEVFPTPNLIYWMKRLPHVQFTNLYGPTEATIASSYYTVPAVPSDERQPIPIGSPCDGEQLHILDERLEPVADGVVGDLYIHGVGLSPGYWQDATKTAEVFVPNPAANDPSDRIYRTGDLARKGDDGLVYFVGRADTQIKSRGYRIELGEIETAFNALAVLRECAVVAVESGGFEGTSICCAYVSSQAGTVEVASLRRAAAELLPTYMLPTRWKEFALLPKNANGKIDRKQLKEMFASEGERRQSG